MIRAETSVNSVAELFGFMVEIVERKNNQNKPKATGLAFMPPRTLIGWRRQLH